MMFCFVGRCLIHWATGAIGAEGWDRTTDAHLFRVPLYRLSYFSRRKWIAHKEVRSGGLASKSPPASRSSMAWVPLIHGRVFARNF